MNEYEREIIIPLTHMPNWLSKRVTPIRDQTKLTRAPERGAWSVREIIAHLRDNEARYFPKLHLIATQEHPNLRRVGPIVVLADPDDTTLTVMSQFRRLRQSTLSLLHELPLDAWKRAGVDVDGSTMTIRDLALELVRHDAEHLAQIDETLIARGALPHGMRPLVAAR
jgi:hypothetical protein